MICYPADFYGALFPVFGHDLFPSGDCLALISSVSSASCLFLLFTTLYSFLFLYNYMFGYEVRLYYVEKKNCKVM